MEKKGEYDPQAPFIAEDGYEYENLAAFLVGEKADCWRNDHIAASRASGVPERVVRTWIEAYDGEDRTPTIVATKEQAGHRGIRANFAVSPQYGLGLSHLAGPRYYGEFSRILAEQAAARRAAQEVHADP